MNLKVLSRNEVFAGQPKWRDPGRSNYIAMYSSVFGGIVTDPALMVLPMDDHMVHRGDGIFEALGCLSGQVYNLDAHLSRLQRSAQLISLDLPFDLGTIREIILETVAIASVKDCTLRVFVSRGIGGFGCNPMECHKSNLYVVVLNLEDETAAQHFCTQGASAVTVQIPVKPVLFVRAKSCSYLLNALAHLEAHRNNGDFAIMLDQNGYLAEGPTEGVAIVSKKKIFMYPKPDSRLESTTLLRAVEFTIELIKNGDLQGISCTDISPEEAYNGSEMLIFSTGLNVVPILKYDEKKIGTGKPGPVFLQLWEFFQRDRRENGKVLTLVPYA